MRRTRIQKMLFGLLCAVLYAGCTYAGSGELPQQDNARSLSNADPAARSKRVRLQQSVGYDPRLGAPVKKVDRAALLGLVSAVKGETPTVQRFALVLLERVVARRAVESVGDLEVVPEAVDSVLARTASSPADEALRDLAEQIRWQMKVQGMSDPKERALYLRQSVEGQGRDSEYYSYEALNHLADLGHEGQEVLLGLKEESRQRSVSPKVLERVETGLARIEVEGELRRLETTDARIALVGRKLTEAKADQSQSGQDYSMWLVGKLEGMGAASKPVLQSVKADEKQGERTRHSAEVGLWRMARGQALVHP